MERKGQKSHFKEDMTRQGVGGVLVCKEKRVKNGGAVMNRDR